MDLQHVITEALAVDRSTSAILEHIMCTPDNDIQGFTTVNLKEVIITTCWYLWWLRRQRTHGDSTPPMVKCTFSILSIVANSLKVYGKQSQNEVARWTRPEASHVKNVDASFHDDRRAGVTGAVLRDDRATLLWHRPPSCRGSIQR
jgi:hypothetical protein